MPRTTIDLPLATLAKALHLDTDDVRTLEAVGCGPAAVVDDLRAIARGRLDEAGLLAQCLDGVEDLTDDDQPGVESTQASWRAYVSAVVAAAADPAGEQQGASRWRGGRWGHLPPVVRLCLALDCDLTVEDLDRAMAGSARVTVEEVDVDWTVEAEYGDVDDRPEECPPGMVRAGWLGAYAYGTGSCRVLLDGEPVGELRAVPLHHGSLLSSCGRPGVSTTLDYTGCESELVLDDVSITHTRQLDACIDWGAPDYREDPEGVYAVVEYRGAWTVVGQYTTEDAARLALAERLEPSYSGGPCGEGFVVDLTAVGDAVDVDAVADTLAEGVPAELQETADGLCSGTPWTSRQWGEGLVDAAILAAVAARLGLLDADGLLAHVDLAGIHRAAVRAAERHLDDYLDGLDEEAREAYRVACRTPEARREAARAAD